MAKYKKYNYSRMVMIPVSLENQLMPGTLEHAIHEVIEKKVDLSIFNERYKNDETGAPAHGVVQGYNAQALVDDKHQIIVHAEAMGNGQDHENLSAMLDGAKENMKAIGKGDDYFKGKELSADAKLPQQHQSAEMRRRTDRCLYTG